MPRPQLLRFLRLLHLYIGVFISPALLFFALTGALQTFGLHETNRDHPNYKPAHWIQVLAQIHKKQVATVPVRRPPAANMAAATQPVAPEAPKELRGQIHGHAGGGNDQPSGSQGASSAPAPQAPPGPPGLRRANPLPLRLFFLLVCVGLFTSTLTGLWMSYAYQRNKVLVSLTLLAGVVIPLILLLF